MHACRWAGHWVTTALMISCMSNVNHSSTNRSTTWSTSRLWKRSTFEDHLLIVSISMMVRLIFTKIGNFIENRKLFMLLNCNCAKLAYFEDFSTCSGGRFFVDTMHKKINQTCNCYILPTVWTFFQTNKATSTFSCTHSWQYFPTLIFMLLVILSIQANQILSAVQTGNIIMLMTYNNNNNNSSTQYKQNSHFQTFNMCGKVKRAYWLFIRWLLSN